MASGQSNMEWPVQQANNAGREIAQAVYPDIRFLIVEQDKRSCSANGYQDKGLGGLRYQQCKEALCRRLFFLQEDPR
ncbi:hypothetical protein ACQ86N_28455 [Puia sp. P3]|uniref:hypothetical protein n=1 Tax=Puia sp. P3 TaxID=3423952 RepID=UPI003D677D44